MSKAQLTTLGSVVPGAYLNILVNAAGSTVRPNPALLNSHKRPSESRKAVLYSCFPRYMDLMQSISQIQSCEILLDSKCQKNALHDFQATAVRYQ